jgi:hypothetical protein
MSNPVTENEIIESLHSVPEDRWDQVLEYLESLRRAPPRQAPVKTGSDLAGSKLIGIWKDRTDIADNRTYARQLRKQAEHREHADAAGH